MFNIRKSLVIAVLVLSWSALSINAAEADLKDSQGKPVQFSSSKGSVLIFMAPDCPNAQAYMPTLGALEAKCSKEKVSFAGVVSAKDYSNKQVESFRQQYHARFPIIMDSDNALATKYGASISPEAVVLGLSEKLVYRGRIDDRFYDIGKQRNGAYSSDLANVIDEISRGQVSIFKETRAVGCDLNNFTTSKSAPTFTEDIAPIVFNNCSVCHRPGQSAPFSLLSYEDVKQHAKSIVRVTQSRYMPPWKPARDFGTFSNENFLTSAQIASIKKWVDSGAAEGDKQALPAVPLFNSDWRMGQPDIILKTKDVYTVPGDGPDIYRAFVIPTSFAENKYVSAVEYRTSNSRVVHHALFFEDLSGEARRKDGRDGKPGYTSFGGPGFLPVAGLGGWAPGNNSPRLPDGVVRVLYKGADVVVQTHYHPTGKEEKEQSEVGLYLSKVPPKDFLLPLTATSHNIDISPGDKEFKVHASIKVPVDVKLINVTPHAHLICKSIKAVAKKPDGSVIPIVWIKDWDFRWQGQYTLAKPIALPKDTVVESDFVYDNSSENPANPSSPPKRVHFGEQTTDEMAILFCGVTTEDPKDVPAFRKGMFMQRLNSLTKDPQALQRLQQYRKRMENQTPGNQTPGNPTQGLDSGRDEPAKP